MADIFNPTPIKDLTAITASQFQTEIRAQAEPVIIRGAVSHWPATKYKTANALFDYLASLDTQKPQATSIGTKGVAGKFHYSDDYKGQNFTEIIEPLSAALSRMLNSKDHDGIYAQSLQVKNHVPGFIDDHALDLIPDHVTPRAWIGTQTTVQTHFDANENIACVVLGEREVTLFPPDQLPNLYPGPLESAPGGVIVSLTSLENPDFTKHPNFKHALKTAQRGRLYPGDVIYIPFGWWHHIRALSPLNMLVNYWWTDEKSELQNPYAAMFHAMMCFHHLRPEQAKTWQNMFAHFVFKQNGDPMAHIPQDKRGILGGVHSKDRQQAVLTIMKTLAKNIGIKV